MAWLRCSLAALAFVTFAHASNRVCPKGSSEEEITIGRGDSFIYKTQAGTKYTGNVNCITNYVRDSSTCRQLKFACQSFKLGRGDYLYVTKGDNTQRFRGRRFKAQVYGGDMQIRFTSNRRRHGPGAKCKMWCSREVPTTTEAPVTTTTIAANTTTEDCPGCQLRTAFGSEETLNHLVKGIFAVWWDKKFDHAAIAEVLVNKLLSVRSEALNTLGMEDPPNPLAGYFYNVYLHHSGQDGDSLPSGWGMGQGTDTNGQPFLTIGYQGYDSLTVLHEGFHVFQYRATSPGYAYAGDSMWYIESSAQWYTATKAPTDIGLFVQAGAIVANPQLALWHSFHNHGPDDPASNEGRPGWMYGVRQYGMHTLLFYLTQVKGVNPAIITDGFYANTNMSPQEYIYTKVGASTMRGYFADWAAHNSANMDYLTRDQYDRGLLEITLAGDWDYWRPYVWSGQDEGTGGQWVRPPSDLTARGWAYNVFNITNTADASYNFELQGDAQGSEGAASFFVGRVVVMGQTDNRFLDMTMSSGVSGQVSVSVTSSDSQVMLVIASVPEFFGSNQKYGYQVKITKG